MTPKEVTNILYASLQNANLAEMVDNFGIYKEHNSERYMVCNLDGENSFHSDIFSDVEECYNWINNNNK